MVLIRRFSSTLRTYSARAENDTYLLWFCCFYSIRPLYKSQIGKIKSWSFQLRFPLTI